MILHSEKRNIVLLAFFLFRSSIYAELNRPILINLKDSCLRSLRAGLGTCTLQVRILLRLSTVYCTEEKK